MAATSKLNVVESSSDCCAAPPISMDHFDGRFVIDGHAGGIAASGLGLCIDSSTVTWETLQAAELSK